MNIQNKTLIISHNSFSDVFNNGKTLESLFSQFNKDELAQLYFSENEIPDFNFCQNYFKVSDVDIVKNLFNRSDFCGRHISCIEENSVIDEREKKIFAKIFHFAKRNVEKIIILRDYLWSFNTWKAKNLFEWVESFNPNVIFFVGGNFGFSHEIAVFLSKKYNIPLTIYFTDDYLIYPKNRNILDYLQRRRMKKFYKRTVQKSNLSYAIGDLMAEEYTKYFKKEFLPIMNSIDIQDYVPYLKNNNKIFYCYFGGLHLNRWKMLVKFAESVSDGQLNVYSITKPDNSILNEFKRVGIEFKGPVSGNSLKEAILSADVLLHVESDDNYNRSLTKLSISTKIPEYLISGRLIIGFGPQDVASMKILSSNKIGVVLSSDLLRENLSQELLKVSSDFKFRKEIGKDGYDFAVKNFDNQKIAENFKNKLFSLY